RRHTRWPRDWSSDVCSSDLVPMKNYLAIMQSLDSLGKVENVSVQRQDRTDAQIDEANAPADVSIQVYSQGNIVTEESGLLATLRSEERRVGKEGSTG